MRETADYAKTRQDNPDGYTKIATVGSRAIPLLMGRKLTRSYRGR